MAATATQRRAYRPLLLVLATVFAALTILYSAAWMYYVRRPSPSPQVEIGFDESYSSAGIEIHERAPEQPGGKGWAEGERPHHSD